MTSYLTLARDATAVVEDRGSRFVCHVARVGDEIHVTAHARSFLHNQVRSMVGSLRRVGDGSWTADDLQAALEARDRARCAALAPPHGLYLTGVDYEGSGTAVP